MDSQCPPGKGACDKDGYYRSTSSDGIHWVDDVVRMLTKPTHHPWFPALHPPAGQQCVNYMYQQAHNPVLATSPPHSIGDVSSFVYDDHNDSYYATIKMFFAVNTTANFTGIRRSVGVSATKVSTRWPQPTLVLTADDIDDRAWGADTAAAKATNNRTELYGLSAFAYQSQYIGLLWVAHFNGKIVREAAHACPALDLFSTSPCGPIHRLSLAVPLPHSGVDGCLQDGTIDVELVSSRDGHSWRRADPAPHTGVRPKLIPRGPAAWDGMMVHTSTHPLMAADGRTLQLFYQGDSCSHHGGSCAGGKKAESAVGLATLRSMGWVSMAHSGGGSGSITTAAVARPAAAAPELKVNFVAQAGGSLEVVLLDAATGAAVDRSAPLTGDELEAAVVWQGGEATQEAPEEAAGGDVRIEFVLKGDVELFAYLLQ